MKTLFRIVWFLMVLTAAVAGAQPTANVPISQMPIAPTLKTNAWFPIIQPITGRVTNDNFRVSPMTVAIGLQPYLSTNTATTNYFTNTITYFTGVTNYITNSIFIENNTTNYVTNSVYYFNGVTNNYTNNSVIYINGTNVATVNPTDGFIPVRLSSNSFGDSPLFVNGSDVDFHLNQAAIGFDMQNSGGGLLRLDVAGADSLITGSGIFNILNTGNHGLSLNGTGVDAYDGTESLGSGKPWNNLYLTNKLYILGFLSGSDYSRLAVSHTGSGGDIILDSQNNGAGLPASHFYVSSNGTPVVDLFNLSSAALINPTIGRYAYNSNGVSLGDGAIYHIATNIAGVDELDATTCVVSNAIYFGDGMTNILLGSGTDLVYTNTGSDYYFKVERGANAIKMGMSGSSGFFQGPTATYLVNASSHGLLFGDSQIQPTHDDTMSIGGPSSSTQLHDLGLKGTIYGWGFQSGTNFSRWSISHTGTNGPIVFESQASGIAGDARNFIFRKHDDNMGTVTVFHEPTSGSLGIGDGSLGTSLLHYNNTAVGVVAAPNLTTGHDNAFFGEGAGPLDLDSSYNTFLGASAAPHNRAGESVVVGYMSGNGITNLQKSVVVGVHIQNSPYYVNRHFVNGVWIGNTLPANTNWISVTNAVLIGYGLMPTNSNEILIGNTDNSKVVFPGTGVRFYVTNWIDSMVPAASVRAGATAPTTAAFGPSGVIDATMFQDARDDTVTFSLQLNHNYKQGTDILPHVHYTRTAAPTSAALTNTVWELTYTWQNVGGVFGNDTTITTTNGVAAVDWTHQVAQFPAITGTGKTVSSILVCRLRRLASTATADNYDKNIAFLGFDCHYQVDSLGSDSDASKTP